MRERCLNCRSQGAEKRDLTARRGRSDEVYLCESCHAALKPEFVYGDGATSE
jgi:predicted SprT family Zn-dependent metalloprotease